MDRTGKLSASIGTDFADTVFFSGLYLAISAFILIVFNSLMFFGHITVKPFFLPLCFFFAAFAYFYLVRRKNIHLRIYGLILALAVFTVFVCISGYVFDPSYDGNWYHKATVGSLTYGWDPVRTDLADFAKLKNGVRIGNLADSGIWADHYCKAAWIFGADLHSLTGNIECAKAVNPTFAYILFSVCFRYLVHKEIFLPACIGISLLCALNPVSIPQMFTFYNDGLLSCALFTAVILLIGFSDKSFDTDKELRAAMLFCILVFLINIKFTGLAYAGFFCLSFWVLELIYAVKGKTIKKFLLHSSAFYVSMLVFAVIIVGWSSYVKNTIDHGHPMYPLFGAQSVDIMTRNQPDSFSGMTNAEKLYTSLFSQTSNPTGEMSTLQKEPFTVDPYEVFIAQNSPDTRIGGMGILFSGILVISIIGGAIALIYLAIRHKHGFFTALALIIPSVLLLIIISESWWARYSPYMWLLPMAVISVFAYMTKELNIYARVPSVLMSVFLIITCTVNNAYFALYSVNAFRNSETIRRELTYLSYISQNERVDIMFPNYAFYGMEYNFKDYDIDYKIVAELGEEHGEIYFGKARY